MALLSIWTASTSDIGQSALGTWSSTLTSCGSPRIEKAFDKVMLNAPVQPGVTATITLLADPGQLPPKSWTAVFDLSKGPTSVATIGSNNPLYQGPISGFLVLVTATLAAPIGTDPKIFALELHGEVQRELVAFDNGAVT